MAITNENVTLDGDKYDPGTIERVAAQLVNENANTFSAANTFQGAIHPANAIAASGSYGSTGDAFTGDAGTLTEVAHAGRTILMPDATGDATLSIPDPSREGIYYHLVYAGVADDAHDMVISMATDTISFKGAIMTHDEDEAGAAQVSTIFANGTDHDELTINDPHAYDLHFQSISTTVVQVWGWIVADTVAAFTDGS